MEGHRLAKPQLPGQTLILDPLFSLSHDLEMPVRTLCAQARSGLEEVRYTLHRRELTYKYNCLCVGVASNVGRREKHAGVGNVRYDLEATAQSVALDRILQGATDRKHPVGPPECEPRLDEIKGAE